MGDYLSGTKSKVNHNSYSFKTPYNNFMNSDKQRNSQIEVSVDYMNDQVLHLINDNQAENAKAILMEWEELMTREDGDDAITVIWMKNLAGSC
jgi:hypothetical protein